MSAIRPRLENAACRGREDLYLSDKPKTGDVALMRKICGTCWDRPECLAWSLEREERGYWAGHSPTARRRLREQYGIELRPIMVGPWTRMRGRTQGEDDGHDELDGAAAVDAG